MSTFTNRTIKSTYDQLLHVENERIQNGLGYTRLTASLDLSGSTALTGSLLVSGATAFTGSVSLSGDMYIDGTASISYLVTTYESASIIYASGSTKFGDSLDDTHEFTGSVTITGSLNSPYISGSFSGSYQGDGSGLTGTITSSHAVTASHAISASYAVSSSEATLATNVFVHPDNTDASTNYVTFGQSASGSARINTDDSFTYVPSTNTLTVTKVIGALEGNATSADTASIVLGTITSASFAVTASYAESQSVINVTSGSFAASGDGPFTGSFSSSRVSMLSGSFTGSSTGSISGSFSISLYKFFILNSRSCFSSLNSSTSSNLGLPKPWAFIISLLLILFNFNLRHQKPFIIRAYIGDLKKLIMKLLYMILLLFYNHQIYYLDYLLQYHL